MTRDEAIEIYGSVCARAIKDKLKPEDFRELTEFDIDAFVALGMLKLDEPKSAIKKFCDIAIQYTDRSRYLEFLAEMDRSGLKIVEK